MKQKITYPCQNLKCKKKWSISLEEFKNKDLKKTICNKCDTKINISFARKLFILKNLKS